MTKAVNNPAEVRLHRKLAIAEAKADMWQEKANELSVKLAEALQTIENVEREIVDVRAYNRSELDRFEKIVNQNSKVVEAANAENNQLRGIIHDLELTNARQNGYIDGVEESLPPRMVEERRSLRRMEATPVDVFVGDRHGGRYGHGETKPWFVR